jgi:hypothetical protein
MARLKNNTSNERLLANNYVVCGTLPACELKMNVDCNSCVFRIQFIPLLIGAVKDRRCLTTVVCRRKNSENNYLLGITGILTVDAEEFVEKN